MKLKLLSFAFILTTVIFSMLCFIHSSNERLLNFKLKIDLLTYRHFSYDFKRPKELNPIPGHFPQHSFTSGLLVYDKNGNYLGYADNTYMFIPINEIKPSHNHVVFIDLLLTLLFLLRYLFFALFVIFLIWLLCLIAPNIKKRMTRNETM